MWRAWSYDGERLCSPSRQSEWAAGQAFSATCPSLTEDHQGFLRRYAGRSELSVDEFPCEWKLTADGEHDLASAYQQTLLYNAFAGSGRPHLTAPTAEPPPGYGYSLVPADGCEFVRRQVTHVPPMEGCRCGIYAVSSPGEVPYPCGFPGQPHRYDMSGLLHVGFVLGTVKLWGKVIRGSRGARAQHAYPSRLFVPSSMLDDDALCAFGVPLIPLDDDPYDGCPIAMAA